MNPVEVIQGDGPVILGLPHGGTHVPADIGMRLNHNGKLLADTDWHITRLYDGLLPSATTVAATFHRYVIDANRDPSGQSLYPGQNTTELCPTSDFDGFPIWLAKPSEDDISARRAAFHAPYHAALAAEVARVKAKHGVAIVYDCHSIRSRIPFLFEGILPTLNIGTDMGKTCDAEIEQATFEIAKASGHTHILNGRFRGGWTTRHYGQPAHGVHAIQMEITQSAYLDAEAPPFFYSQPKAEALRVTLKTILETLEAQAKELA
ncbi:N-formylglutamate deformylase [Aestuariivirga litoralis]|uniref:N-formylglutamate deformylase n=1 Tax=Aestuariivirga litoralis TaxID=2650924 RepID=UPI0018C51514|nr:N-formylglutamate deformylase [Aestuariivirga litoralis]MBG1232661.1 N-formylglutamate deformylase [Aestuariivirga litoralis]